MWSVMRETVLWLGKFPFRNRNGWVFLITNIAKYYQQHLRVGHEDNG